MNVAACRRANLLSNTNLVLMFSLVFMAGVLTLVESPILGNVIFWFTLVRAGTLLITNTTWIVAPIPMMIILGITVGQVIGYYI